MASESPHPDWTGTNKMAYDGGTRLELENRGLGTGSLQVDIVADIR